MTQSYDKSPLIDRKFKKSKRKHSNATINFDYLRSVYRLRTISWSNDSNPTGLVIPIYGIPTSHLVQELFNQRDTRWKIVNNPPHTDQGATVNRNEEVIKKSVHKHRR